MELDTVISSDLKQYLLDPDLPLISNIKIGFPYYITNDLVLQLNILKGHLEIESFKSLTIY